MALHLIPSPVGGSGLDCFESDACERCGWVGTGAGKEYTSSLVRSHGEYHDRQDAKKGGRK